MLIVNIVVAWDCFLVISTSAFVCMIKFTLDLDDNSHTVRYC